MSVRKQDSGEIRHPSDVEDTSESSTELAEETGRIPKVKSAGTSSAVPEFPSFGNPKTNSRNISYSQLPSVEGFEHMCTPARGYQAINPPPVVPTAPPVPAAPQAPGFNLNMTSFLQVIQLIVIVAGASIAFGVQREQIEQLKINVQELKREHVAKEVYNERLQEQERTNKRIEDKMDRIDGLLRSLYEKLQNTGR